MLASGSARWSGQITSSWHLALDALELSRAEETLVPDAAVWGIVLGAAVGIDTGNGPSFDECVAERRRLVTEPEQLAMVAFEEGRQCLHQGRVREAIERFEAARPVPPTFEPWRIYFLTVAHVHHGDAAELPPGFHDVVVDSGDAGLMMHVHAFDALRALHRGESLDEWMPTIVRTARDNGILQGFLGEVYASIALEAGEARAAALLFGTSVGWSGGALVPNLELRIREALGDEEYERLLAEGAALDEDEIAALVLGLADR
jgi:hypothetical protein